MMQGGVRGSLGCAGMMQGDIKRLSEGLCVARSHHTDPPVPCRGGGCAGLQPAALATLASAWSLVGAANLDSPASSASNC